MKTIYVVLLALFGVAAGLFLGMGNHHGLLGAILPGLLGGLLLSIPLVRERDRKSTGVLIACVLVGSFVAALVPDSNNVKQYCRNQTGLHIRVGGYELGRGLEQ
jgi:hypothetical protein